MKKSILLFTLFLFITHFALAQISKGTKILGLDLGFSNTKTEFSSAFSGSYKSKKFSITFNPAISYFISDRFSLGLTLPFSFSKHVTENELLESSTARFTFIAAGPQIRYYFPLNNWAVFPFGSFAYGFSKSKSPQFHPSYGVYTAEIKGKYISATAGGGVTYFINESVGIEALLFYKYEDLDNEDFEDTDQKEKGVHLNFGLQFYLK